jgi:hypothetical protein
VSFHGDAASGCAAYGLCAYSGAIVVRPRIGDLEILTERRHHGAAHGATLFLAPAENGYLAVANVQRAIPGQPSGTCADGGTSGFGGTARVSGHSLTLSVLSPGGSLLSTRCAGPLDGDLAGASPTVTIPLRTAMRGGTTIDLGGSRSFASHGFAGVVTSTLELVLGRPSRGSSHITVPPGFHTKRVRTVTEHLSVVRVSGSLRASVQGTSDPVVCRLLDSCGLAGTISVTPGSGNTSAEVFATGPASRPYGDFLAALRRGPGDQRGIGVNVLIGWSAGTVTAALNQAGVCTDTAPLGNLGLALALAVGRDRAAGSGESSPWRTRCPGPMIGGQASVWSATFPAQALARRSFTIEARSAGSLSEDGYTISLHGRVSVTVRRGRLSENVIVEPVPGPPA